MDRILISACLLGRPVRYDGRGKQLENALLERWQAEGRLVPVCPEVAAGFPTPRLPAEIAAAADGTDVLAGGARVIDSTGQDVTAQFLRGARIALETARGAGARHALLTDRSPSCGSGFLHDGSFSGTRHPGRGVTAVLLQQGGINVWAESEIEQLAKTLGL